MPKKSRSSRRSLSRKHTRKHRVHRKRTHRRRSTRRRGGAASITGAPLNYHLSGSWPSQMSLGQGADYFKYHEGQHGGSAPYPEAVLDKGLPAALRGPALIGGIDKAFNDVKHLKDQAGGKRRRGSKRSGSKRSGSKRRSSKHHRKSSKKHHKTRHTRRRTHRKRRGGALGYAPFPSSGMLLSSPAAYTQAGLNPEWKTDVAFTDAKNRDTQ